MSLFGTLGFTYPLALFGLLTLPIIWWLLRMTPPAPQKIAFPSNKILKQVQSEQPTAHKSPWWLTALRLLAAACLIFALAAPLLNPSSIKLEGKGPLALLIDNDWSSAQTWPQRQITLEQLISAAQAGNRRVYMVTTASAAPIRKLEPLTPKQARGQLSSIKPKPFSPNRSAALKALKEAMQNEASGQIYWLKTALGQRDNRGFHDQLSAFVQGRFELTQFSNDADALTVGLYAKRTSANELTVALRRIEAKEGLDAPSQTGKLSLFDRQGRAIDERPVTIKAGSTGTTLKINLPGALLQKIDKIKLSSHNSAGATFLMDRRNQWPRMGLMSGTNNDGTQPLLAPLYYIRRAIHDKAEQLVAKNGDADAELTYFLSQKASIIVAADVGKFPARKRGELIKWINKGGILMRFSGPNVEGGTDDLLPVPLRQGGRSLGGALSWSTAQPLATFDKESLFVGLTIPKEIIVKRQVLADPSFINESVKIWARLQDGTPLVTAKKLGDGWLIFFHITANADWSNLPLSGLFVNMMDRLTQLSQNAFASPQENTSPQEGTSEAGQIKSAETGPVLSPLKVLDGYGNYGAVTPNVEPILLKNFNNITPSQKHPPGLYGAAQDMASSLNLLGEKTRLFFMKDTPSAKETRAYAIKSQKPLAPLFFSIGLILLLVDTVLMLFLKGASPFAKWRRSPATLSFSPIIGLLSIGLFLGGSLAVSPYAFAQAKETEKTVAQNKTTLLRDSLTTRLAYVRTGNSSIDHVSRSGLYGLSVMLKRRTSIEPADPVGVSIEKDELSFYPILYWPIAAEAKALSPNAVARVSKFLKNGGMIIFDTRNPNYDLIANQLGQKGLRALINQLDIPRLAPVPRHHVLTRAFYLLKRFPGRFDSDELWVRYEGKNRPKTNRLSRVDGVSSILVTNNDFASAWALDKNSRPLFAVTPGGEFQREMAYRVGINIVMYALTGNYKADQVHVPALLERLGE